MLNAHRTSIGGQALLEGIMMRGPDKTAVVVSAPDGLHVKTEDFVPLSKRHKILGLPLIRGVPTFVKSMSDGMSALFWSAEQLEEPSDKTDGKASGKGDKILFFFAALIGIALAIGLFTVLPTLAGSFFARWIGSGILRNVVETVLRLIILFLYMLVVSKQKDIKRTFAYHGAEHKSIACYEKGEALTVENVAKMSRFHPRCGTSFLLTVVVISLFCFIWVRLENPLIRIGLRLALLPVVVAVSYEINRLVGRYDNIFTKIIRTPGLWLQRLTTIEPDAGMINVAIEALRLVIPAHEGDDEWGRE